VEFIHKNGLVHLDLSLENILLTKQKVLKICDFGLAREGRIFKLPHPVGKLPYMAPEVFAKKEFDGQKADVWSLGVILWCLVTSLALYEMPTDTDARFQRLRSGKKGIKELLKAFQVDGIPESVIDLLSGMLNVNPNQRLSIKAVLDHPWLNPTPESNPLSSSISSPSKSLTSTTDNGLVEPTQEDTKSSPISDLGRETVSSSSSTPNSLNSDGKECYTTATLGSNQKLDKQFDEQSDKKTAVVKAESHHPQSYICSGSTGSANSSMVASNASPSNENMDYYTYGSPSDEQVTRRERSQNRRLGLKSPRVHWRRKWVFKKIGRRASRLNEY